MTDLRTIVGVLRERAASTPDAIAHTFLSLGSTVPASLSYRALDRHARAVAVRLIGTADRDRAVGSDTIVLVALPAGLDFVTAYFGCLYAGAIAVPVRYPNPRRPLTHIESVAADCGATIVLTSTAMGEPLSTLLTAITVLTPDDFSAAEADGWSDPGIMPKRVAHLQYTSGSTAAPKGVAIRHDAIMANSLDLQRSWHLTPDSRTLSWLPHYHDLGLIFGCIQPVYAGCGGFLMSPATFAQRPLSWLQAITEHRITHTAAPDFAYRTCAAILAPARSGIELSSLHVAANGAEPVRAETIAAFAHAYAASGFRPEAMCPAYGLAESTLVATTTSPDRPPFVATVSSAALADGLLTAIESGQPGRTLVSSSGCATGSSVVIVDPETRELLPPGRTGEIWLAGPSIATGYWRRDVASEARFRARLADDTDGRTYLRTGDLGGTLATDLFVLGRIDDLVIIRGVNLTCPCRVDRVDC